MDDQQFNVLSKLYQSSPETFTDDDVQNFQQIASEKGFDIPRNQDAGDFNLWNTIGQLGAGFIEGFSTFDVGSKPQNTVEEIARKVGDVLGFVGYIPGVGTATKLGAMGIGKVAMALRAGEQGIKIAEGIRIGGEALGKALSKSVPMHVGEWFTEKVAGKTLRNPSLQAKMFLGAPVANIARGAITLGAASAVGAAPIYDLSIQSLVDKRLPAFLQGGAFGGGQALAGQLISRTGKWNVASLLGIEKPAEDMFAKVGMPGQEIATKAVADWTKKADMANNIVRGLAVGIAMGAPAQIMSPDAPLALHVYDYLVNGIFGYREMPYATKRAKEIISQKYSQPESILPLMKAERMDDLKNEPPEVIDELKLWSSIEFGRIMKMDYDNQSSMVSGTGQDIMSVFADVAKSKGLATQILQVRYIKQKISDAQVDAVQSGESLTIEKEQEIADNGTCQ